MLTNTVAVLELVVPVVLYPIPLTAAPVASFRLPDIALFPLCAQAVADNNIKTTKLVYFPMGQYYTILIEIVNKIVLWVI